MDLSRKILVITGHYGSGKTNLSLNLALWLRRAGDTVTIADLYIVNPYFRTADFRRLFEREGLSLAASDYAGSGIDVPAVNLDILARASQSQRLIIDVGGDAEGAKALGRYAPVLSQQDYAMIYVINSYRYLTRSAGQAVSLLRDIERSSGLKCSALFNNSNLGNETTAEVIEQSLPFADEVSRLTGLPLLQLEFPLRVYVKPIWERGV